MDLITTKQNKLSSFIGRFGDFTNDQKQGMGLNVGLGENFMEKFNICCKILGKLTIWIME